MYLRVLEKWGLIFLLVLSPGTAHSYESMTAVLARINVSYQDPVSGLTRSVSAEIGRFADGAVGNAEGILATGIHHNTAASKATQVGCSAQFENVPSNDPWIGLFIRGSCSDEEKVKNARALNASAILLFGNDQETYLQKENKFVDGPVVIYLLHRKGELFWHLVQTGTKVTISITKGQEVRFRITSINRTSVLFVSVSFIVLMVISLAWLIFYYVQRFRYLNAKDRLTRHLNNAAKKALSKIPDRHLRSGDMEVMEKETCAVCIEPYLQGDTIRVLPCKHHFHKACVDPWLLEHRTCPMCKMDILKHYGFAPSPGEDGTGRADRRDDTQATEPRSNPNRDHPALSPQVSVISTADGASCDVTTMQRAASTPSADVSALPPISSHSISAIGTTTSAVIRSMIQSARSRVLSVNPSDGSTDTIIPIQDTVVIVEKKGGASEKFSDSISEDSAIVMSSPEEEEASTLCQNGSLACDVENLVTQILHLDNQQTACLADQHPASIEMVDETCSQKRTGNRTLAAVQCAPVPLQHSSDLTTVEVTSSLGVPAVSRDDPMDMSQRRPSTTVATSHS